MQCHVMFEVWSLGYCELWEICEKCDYTSQIIYTIWRHTGEKNIGISKIFDYFKQFAENNFQFYTHSRKNWGSLAKQFCCNLIFYKIISLPILYILGLCTHLVKLMIWAYSFVLFEVLPRTSCTIEVQAHCRVYFHFHPTMNQLVLYLIQNL